MGLVYKLNTKINIGILDYGVGNITSLINCIDSLSLKTKIIRNTKDLQGITTLILPGVGAMNFAMQNIKKRKLDVLIKKIFFEKKIKLIGICLGMQLFYEYSEEGGTKCLGLLDGKVKKFPENFCHVGWNHVETKFLADIDTKYKNFYFNHSFYVPFKSKYAKGSTKSIEDFSSIIQKDNFIGLQFHPEKSQFIGRKLLNELLLR